MICKLCFSGACDLFHADGRRGYLRCASCGLVFVPEQEWVTWVEEKERYALHSNSMANTGYVSFLEEVVRVIQEMGGPEGSVLDFGSGQEAVLTALLRNAGFNAVAYDPLYNIGMTTLSGRYDTVVLCEVVEHLRNLRAELHKIKEVISSRGSVIIRTQLYESAEKFRKWWYTEDCTHINFFSVNTLEYIAGFIGGRLELTGFPDIFRIRCRERCIRGLS